MKKFLLVPCFALALLMSPASVFAQAADGTVFTDVAVGTSHICGLTDTSEARCTTASHSTRYGPPENLPLLTAIVAGDQHTCGIDLDGQAVCWGDTDTGAFNQLVIPDITQPLESIAAGAHHTCAVDVTGRVWCWGLNTNLQAEPPNDGLGVNGEGFVKVAGGLNFSCGIQTNGDIACWTTDTRMGDTSNIPGPFVDLDVDFNNACGLKEDGSIECWFGRVEPPVNGPYTDLVVSFDAVCGLTGEGELDCTFRDGGASDQSALNPNLRYTSLASGTDLFGRQQPFCGVTTDGAIECARNGFIGFAVPGSMLDANPLAFVRPFLTARRYSKDQIELFWTPVPFRQGPEQILIEIYRNDELLDTTLNSGSWYDDSIQTENPVTYRIRPINLAGDEATFSTPVVVDNTSGTVTLGGEPPMNFPPRESAEHIVRSIQVVRFAGEQLVVWQGSVPGDNGLKGYELRLNNEPVLFTTGFSTNLSDLVDTSRCHVITVAAIADDDTIIDYRAVVFNRLSRNFSCLIDR